MSDKLTDSRGGFTTIQNVIFTHFDLTPHEFAIYAALCYHANKQGESWPGMRRLEKETHMARNTVIKSIEALEEKKLIKVRRETKPNNKRKTNHYFIQDANQVVQEMSQGGSPDEPPPGSPDEPEQESSLEQESKDISPSGEMNHPPPTEANGKQPDVGKDKKESTPRSEFNAMKDAILAAFGWKAEDVVSWGIINSAASKLCKSKYTPDEVPGIYEVVKKKNFETFTPMVLVKYAPEYRAKQRRIEEMEQRQSESEQLPPPEMWT